MEMPAESKRQHRYMASTKVHVHVWLCKGCIIYYKMTSSCSTSEVMRASQVRQINVGVHAAA